MNNLVKNLFPCIFAILLAACGGGGGGGVTQSTAAIIDSANAKQLGTAATEGLKQAALNDAGSAIGFRSADQIIVTPTQQLVASLSDRAAGRSSAVNCGVGSTNETINQDGSTTIEFTNCDLLGLGLLEINGTVTVSDLTVGDTRTVTINYDQLILDDGTNVLTIDMLASCTTNTTTLDTSCNFTDVEGIDGRTYVISGTEISGNAVSGYTISATITDPVHGDFDIETTVPILFGCANGQPSSGQVRFTDADGVIVTVTFNDCDSFTVSYNGTSEVFFW